MSDRYSYLALNEDFQLVLDWFKALPDEITVNDRSDRVLYYFRNQAKSPLAPVESIDQKRTPLVFASRPQRVRGTLWTDAEVLFTPKPFKSQFPLLYRTSKSFEAWLSTFDRVFSQKGQAERNWNYYLEGGVQNFNAELYALPRAMQALKGGQYFVHHRDSPSRVETVAKILRLRGYDVASA